MLQQREFQKFICALGGPIMERPLSYGREHIQTFVSPAETAFASVERTANQLRRDIHRMLRTQGLTLAQYNVLRALGKEASGGLTCSELGNRLAGADPDITRLLDRLAKQRLVRRRRDIRDRRAVVTELTEQGRCCWHPSPPSLDARIGELFDHMAPARLQLLIELLAEARKLQKSTERASQPLPAHTGRLTPG
jgi:DNA-binding MarR family transcriptional regulator